jgi:hypothetical protein
MNPSDQFPSVCALCGAGVGPGMDVCPACGGRIGPTPAEPGRNPYEAPPPTVTPRMRFSVGSLMVLVAVVAVGLGTLVAATPLGVLALMLGVPAGARTWYEAARARGQGRPLDGLQLAGRFAIAAGLTFVVWVCAGIACLVACTPIAVASGSTEGFVAGMVVGVAAAAAAAWFVARSLFAATGLGRWERGGDAE